MKDVPVMRFASHADWLEWLEANHDAYPDGIWLEFTKKGNETPSVSRQEALDGALAYGWIDGQALRSPEEGWSRQRWLPRRARSKWSQINVAKVEAKIAAGTMRPPGLAEVERARADGRWDAAYAPPSRMTVPDDLAQALERASPQARAFFEQLSSQNRYAILFQVHEAKRPETRARRIEKFVGMCERGETVH